MEQIKLLIVILPLLLPAPTVVNIGPLRYQIKYLTTLRHQIMMSVNTRVCHKALAYAWFASDCAHRRHRSNHCSRDQGTLNIPVRARVECHRAALFINELVTPGTALADIS